MATIKDKWKPYTPEMTEGTPVRTSSGDTRAKDLNIPRHTQNAEQTNEAVKSEQYRTEANRILEQCIALAKETNIPTMYTFPRDGKNGSPVSITVSKVAGVEEPFITVGDRTKNQSKKVSLSEAVDVLAAYGIGAGGYQRLNNEVKDASKLGDLLEELNSSVKELRQPVEFMVGSDRITMSPQKDKVDQTAWKEKAIKDMKSFAESVKKQYGKELMDLPLREFRDMKSEAKSMAGQTK